MPIMVWIDKDQRLIRSEVSGSFSEEAISNAINESVGHPDYEPGFNVLSDHTRVTEFITTPQAYSMARHLESLSDQMANVRWAVVTREPASYGMMRMMSVLVERVPMEVQIFATIEEAEEWVGSSPGTSVDNTGGSP
jgi:hypothetical protein